MKQQLADVRTATRSRAIAHRNKHLRDRECVKWDLKADVPKEFRKYVENEILPLIPINGRKLAQKRRITIRILNALVRAGHRRVVSDTRDNSEPGASLRIGIWDAILRTEPPLAIHCPGSEWSELESRYAATAELMKFFPAENWQVGSLTKASFEPNGLVILRDAEKNQIPIPAEWKKSAAKTARFLSQLNEFLLLHHWLITDGGKTFPSEPLDPRVRQIHSGAMQKASRHYTNNATMLGVQRVPKSDRRFMRIDHKPIAEMDFSCFSLRCLYHLKGIDPPRDEDLYRPHLIFREVWQDLSDEDRERLRGLVKVITNTCWNVSSKGKALCSIGNRLRTDEKKDQRENEERRFLRSVVFRIPAFRKAPAASLLARVQSAHSDLEHYFFSNTGRELFSHEGAMMRDIMAAFMRADKPLTPLHDAVICKASHARFAKKTMRKIYRKHFGFWPVINREI